MAFCLFALCTPMTLPTFDLGQWLSAHRIWGLLSASARRTLMQGSQELELQRGQVLAQAGQWPDALWLIVEGRINLNNTQRQHTHAMYAGEAFGQGATAIALQQQCTAQAGTDAHLLQVPVAVLQTLLQTDPALEPFFPVPVSGVLPGKPSPGAQQSASQEISLLSRPLHSLVRQQPITLPPSLSILQVAQAMRERSVSSIMLTENNQLVGLVTDRDMRNRALAASIDVARPVLDIATQTPKTLDHNSSASEALLMMARHNIHHIPVMDGERIVGMVTATDLTRQHGTSAVYLSSDIHHQTDVEGLAKISHKVRTLQQQLAAAHTSAYDTGHIITTITDALTTRLIQLAEGLLGPTPVPYVWVAAGSQARSEQTAKSDQDNCLILDDSFDEDKHGPYFKAFSKMVCDGLAECGYIHCPGEMMAMTDQWRQPLRQWREYFQRWVNVPDGKSLMLTSVFFDLRAVYGQSDLLSQLRDEVLDRTRGNTLFLAHMVGNAQKLRPPLNLFGQISTIRSGEHAGTVDLKHQALAPIVDLGRIYALASGLNDVNTHDRIASASSKGEISAQSARDLRDALEFIASLRIAHQTQRMNEGLAPDNYLSLDELSNFERAHLRDAFSIIQSLQSVLGNRYHF